MSETMTVLTNIAFVSTDLMTVISVVGSVIILAATLIELATKRQMTLPVQIIRWSTAGMIIGFLGLAILFISGNPINQPIGVFRMNVVTIGILLVASLMMLMIHRAVQSSGANKS